MFHLIKAVRETAAARADKTAAGKTRSRTERPRPDQIYLSAQLRREIDRTRRSIDSARNHFEQVVDPTLIDCYIYELNAAQLRYQFLLRKFKSQEE